MEEFLYMIGDNIKKIRESKDLGLNELARMAKMNASYLSAIEQNKKINPSVKTLEKIAKALDVYPQSFHDTEPMSDEEMKMYDDMYQSSRENRNIIPEEFTKVYEAREYIEMHKIFASEGFNLNKMSDEDILDFGNALLEQMKMVGYKFKNK